MTTFFGIYFVSFFRILLEIRVSVKVCLSVTCFKVESRAPCGNGDARDKPEKKHYSRVETDKLVYSPKEEGVDMAKAGEIEGVGIAHRKDNEYLKSLPDGSEDNNLGNLPAVSADDVEK